MNIIGVLLLCIFACFVSGQEISKEEALVWAGECATETGATQEDIGAMFAHQLPTTKESKCLRACVLQKFGIMNEAGMLLDSGFETGAQFLAQGDMNKLSIAKEVLKKCKGNKLANDMCEAAGDFAVCVKMGAEDHGIQWSN